MKQYDMYLYNIMCVQPNRAAEMTWPDYRYRITAVNRLDLKFTDQI